MAIEKSIRALAISHFKDGHKPKFISAVVRTNIDTVRRWIREFKLQGKQERLSPPGRPVSASNKTNIREVKRLIRNHSQRSLVKMLPKPASLSTVRRIIKKLKLKVIIIHLSIIIVN